MGLLFSFPRDKGGRRWEGERPSFSPLYMYIILIHL